MSSRNDYINALEVNSLIAFKLDKLEAKMYSGKVTKIGKTKVEVETKNGRKFFVNKDDIHWVNTTGKWPAHIMQALKGIDMEEEEPVIMETKEDVALIEDENGIIADEVVVQKEEVVEDAEGADQ